MDKRKERKGKGYGFCQAALQTVVFAMAVAIFAVPASASIVDRIAAEVNDEIILESEVKERISQLKISGKTFGSTTAEEMRKVLNLMIDERLIIQFGKERGISIKERDVDMQVSGYMARMGVGKKEFRQMLAQQGLTVERLRTIIEDQNMAKIVISSEVRSQVKLTPRAIKDYYDDDPERFKSEMVLWQRHILIKVPKNASAKDRRKALRKIKRVRKMIVDEGMDFSDAARQNSQGPSGPRGGDLGEVRPGMMIKKFEDASMLLKVGEVSQPVLTGFGWHIIIVDKKQKPVLLPFKEVKEKVKQAMYNEVMNEIQEEWVARIRHAAFVDIKKRK